MFVTDDWLIERSGVHRSTVARWRASRRFPPALERLFAIEVEGRIEHIHTAWAGFKIDASSGELVTPGGERYRPGEIVAFPIRWQLHRELMKPKRRGWTKMKIATRSLFAVLVLFATAASSQEQCFGPIVAGVCRDAAHEMRRMQDTQRDVDARQQRAARRDLEARVEKLEADVAAMAQSLAALLSKAE